jgi:3-methyladenine DNA glycosylase AlkC
MEPFKTFLSPEVVRLTGDHIARHLPGFDARAFAAPVIEALPALELKARAQAIADALHAHLPPDGDLRARVLTAALHPDPLDHAGLPADASGLCGWAVLPLTMVVGQHGVGDFARGMEVLREMTKRFTAEFGIRHFILADQARALSILGGWLSDGNRHVRRLISEGTRPRLPWAMRLPALMRDPAPVLPLLDALRDDPEPYVRRSVANHLNDIAKDHPALVVSVAQAWMAGAPPERAALLKHACRSLVKAGNGAALSLFGHAAPEVRVGALSVTPEVREGGTLRIACDLTSASRTAQNLAVDFVIHFRKANGRLSPKVFKGAVIALAPGETRTFARDFPFRPVTTRRHYPGRHAVSLRINGQDTPLAEFVLVG